MLEQETMNRKHNKGGPQVVILTDALIICIGPKKEEKTESSRAQG